MVSNKVMDNNEATDKVSAEIGDSGESCMVTITDLSDPNRTQERLFDSEDDAYTWIAAMEAYANFTVTEWIYS